MIRIVQRNLSALVANLVDADLRVILTDQARIVHYRSTPGSARGVISECTTSTTASVVWREEAVRDGTGGMMTKSSG